MAFRSKLSWSRVVVILQTTKPETWSYRLEWRKAIRRKCGRSLWRCSSSKQMYLFKMHMDFCRCTSKVSFHLLQDNGKLVLGPRALAELEPELRRINDEAEEENVEKCSFCQGIMVNKVYTSVLSYAVYLHRRLRSRAFYLLVARCGMWRVRSTMSSGLLDASLGTRTTCRFEKPHQLFWLHEAISRRYSQM